MIAIFQLLVYFLWNWKTEHSILISTILPILASFECLFFTAISLTIPFKTNASRFGQQWPKLHTEAFPHAHKWPLHCQRLGLGVKCAQNPNERRILADLNFLRGLWRSSHILAVCPYWLSFSAQRKRNKEEVRALTLWDVELQFAIASTTTHTNDGGVRRKRGGWKAGEGGGGRI